MKVLLIYPEMPKTFWNMKFLSQMVGKKSDYPPLGLLTVAALLPKDWEVKLIDLNTNHLTSKQLKWPDLIFIGAMSVQIDSAKQIVDLCKSKGLTIVAGGPLFVHDHKEFDQIDHFVLNEAEITLPQFIKDYTSGSPKRMYQTTDFVNLHETPVPRYDLINLSHYAYGILQYSRGCPFQCDFCDVTQLYGQKTRTKTSEQIIQELNALGDFMKLDLVLFADDNLIGNIKQVKTDLLPALIKWRKETKPPIGFATQVSINLANDSELMELMLEAGFRHIFIGIETPESESLKASLKNQNLKVDLIESIRRLHQKGFVVTGGFIVGFDTDSPEIFELQAALIQESGVVISTVNLLKAPGGTSLHARMQKENRLLHSTNFDEQRINFIPRMPIDDLYQGFGELLSNVLLPDPVFQRVQQFMQDYRGAQVKNKLNRNYQLRDVGTFLRLLIKIGILGQNQKIYWRLLIWGLRNYPRQMDHIFLFIVLSCQFKILHKRFVNYEASQDHQEFLATIRARI